MNRRDFIKLLSAMSAVLPMKKPDALSTSASTMSTDEKPKSEKASEKMVALRYAQEYIHLSPASQVWYGSITHKSYVFRKDVIRHVCLSDVDGLLKHRDKRGNKVFEKMRGKK